MEVLPTLTRDGAPRVHSLAALVALGCSLCRPGRQLDQPGAARLCAAGKPPYAYWSPQERAVFTSITRHTGVTKLLEKFHSLDLSGDGLLGEDEFAAALGLQDASPKYAARLFSFFDADGSGAISYVEFVPQRV